MGLSIPIIKIIDMWVYCQVLNFGLRSGLILPRKTRHDSTVATNHVANLEPTCTNFGMTKLTGDTDMCRVTVSHD